MERGLRLAVGVLAALLALAGLVRLLRLLGGSGVLTVLVVVLVVVGLLWWLRRRHLPGRILLELDLDDAPIETRDDHPLAALSRDERPLLREVVDGLERAAQDPRVVAVVVRVGSSGLGLARAQELRDAVGRIRAAGKRTVAFAETFAESGNGTVDYYLASAFGEIDLQPGGQVALVGLLARRPFLRGLLDRIDVVPRFARRHEYKSASELFTERTPTPANREATRAVLSSSLEQVVEGIAEGRGLDPGSVRRLMDRGPFTASQAIGAGLVDRLCYRDETEATLEELTGGERVRLADYRRRIRHRGRRPLGGPRIALVYGTGTVMRGRSRPDLLGGGGRSMGADDVADAIRSAAEDRRIRAIVFRVDSRGGSAVASETIWRAVVRARAAGTPVVASLGDVAGSGGYYVAVGADRIVAQPGTVTGSIGVVGGKLVTGGAWQRLGVRWHHESTGPRAELFAPELEPSDDAWERVQQGLDAVYADFTAKVVTGRGLTPEQVDEVARGRIWTGRDARAHGLVDECGGLQRAIELAAELAEVPDVSRVRLVPLPRSPRLPWRRWAERRRATAAALAELRSLAEPVAEVVAAASDAPLRTPPL